MWSRFTSFVYLIWIVNVASIVLEDIPDFVSDIQAAIANGLPINSNRSNTFLGEYSFSYSRNSSGNRNLLSNYGTMITKFPPDFVQITAGKRLELLCEAIGHPAPQIFWNYRRNGTYENWNETIASITESHEIGRNFSIVSSKLVIDCVTNKNQGLVKCISVSGNITNESITVLRVRSNGSTECDENKKEPTITLHSRVIIAEVNSTATLPCRFTDKLISDFNWLDEDNQIINSITRNRRTVLSNGDLQITDLQPSDMGTYTCVIRSGSTETTASTFLYSLLYMKYDPASRNITIKVGQSANHVVSHFSLFFYPLPLRSSRRPFQIVNLI